MKKIVIAIDGFSSCGKSTMSKELANRISYTYVDSGAMYRAVTLFAMKNNLFTNKEIDKEKFLEILNNSKINLEFRYNPTTYKSETYLNGENVEQEIRQMNVSDRTSQVSSVAEVRKLVDDNLHTFGQNGGIVMDGRDIGTTVFPNAELKIFVTADPKVRAQRRFDELRSKGDMSTTFEEVYENLQMRDHLDQNRKESPLTQAEDAIVLDNTNLSKEEQMNWLLNIFSETIKKYE